MTNESGKISGDRTPERAATILTQAAKLAEQQRLFGWVGVKVSLEDGKITHISEETHTTHK